MIKGIDKSHWQQTNSDIDNSRLGFCFIKATEGLSTDTALEKHAANIAGSHLLRGFYHFFKANINGIVQAQHFCDAIKQYMDIYSLPPVLDLEDPNATTEGLQENVQGFLNQVESLTGFKPIIYINKNFLEQHQLSFSPDYPLWDACYQSNPATPYGQWTKATLWQFTDSSKVEGEVQKVDGDLFMGTPEELISLTKSLNYKGGLSPTEWVQKYNVQIF